MVHAEGVQDPGGHAEQDQQVPRILLLLPRLSKETRNKSRQGTVHQEHLVGIDLSYQRKSDLRELLHLNANIFCTVILIWIK